MLNRVLAAVDSRAVTLFVLALLVFSGCEKSENHMTDSGPKPPSISKDEALSVVNEVIDDFEFVHQSILSAASLRKGSAARAEARVPTPSQPIVMKAGADSIFVYGDTATIDGVLHGIVVTERHSYPKGLLLITKASKYAPANRRGVASVTDRYITWAQYNAGTPEQRTMSIIRPQFTSGTDSTIEAYVLRTKGLVTLSETFRFTTPTVTIDVSKGTRVVRCADPVAGQIVSFTYDQASGALLTKRATGEADAPPYGGFYTHTFNYITGELASWVKTTTIGQADRSVLRTVERYP